MLRVASVPLTVAIQDEVPMDYDALSQVDPQAYSIMAGECWRQESGLELIPSENYVSEAVLAALGSVFTNKYSEGTPGRRYYGGQEYTDAIERLAIARAKTLFAADHANVQALSGAAANLAIYSAWLKPGDTVLGMHLEHGGHLTHGAPVTFPAQIYRFVRYGMADRDTGRIDYQHLEALALEHRPRLILAGFSAYPKQLDYHRFAAIAEKVGALALADMSHLGGLIAAGLLPNPLEAGFHVMMTTTHKSLRGPRGALILSRGQVGNPLKKPPHELQHLPTLIDRAVFPGLQGGPHMNQIMAIAVALLEAQQPAFRNYAQAVLKNAQTLAEQLKQRGCQLIGGGTENHLVLIDGVRSFDMNGKQIQELLDSAGITLNRNAIPDDPLPMYQCSGVRLGTPAVTTRGMGQAEMIQIAAWIVALCRQQIEPQRVRAEVEQLCERFPLPTRDLPRPSDTPVPASPLPATS